MATIVRTGLASVADGPWESIAAQAVTWAIERDIALRDAIVIVPFAQLLGPARAAFAARIGPAGWQPRIETTQTLAASLGPLPALEPGQISGDAGIDRLAAAPLLLAQAWGRGWSRRDPRGFASALSDLVGAAQALVRASAAVAPTRRAEHWARGRQALAAIPGPGAEEQLLARVALEWASVAPAPVSDRLFALRPSAWIVVQAAGADALCRSLCGIADPDTDLAPDPGHTPCLWLNTDAPDDDPFIHCEAAPALAVCDDFEDEAECAAACVIEHLRAGNVPIALVAEDRLLVRRIRALLARHAVRLHDETGWKLSTTRAAAGVVGLLDSSLHDASADALLDWLKSGTRWSADDGADDRAVASLESLCRRHGLWRVAAIDAQVRGGPLAAWWARVSGVLTAFAALPRQSLDAWLTRLADALQACGRWPLLRDDDAGRQVLAVLCLEPAARQDAAWALGVGATMLARGDFDAWLRSVLEDESYKPTDRFAGAAQVVVTPLARVMLRPFAAVVLPGADDRHLGARTAPHPLFRNAQAAALGIATATERQRIGLQCFAQALAMPRVALLRRRLDGSEPLAASPWVERLGLALGQRGHAMRPWSDARLRVTLPATPSHPGSPSAPRRLPQRLSATALEALRACPYRFFALYLLGLRDDEELSSALDKRDFGSWLHAVLHRFHLGRGAPAAAPDEVARLRLLAAQAATELGFDAAEFLPFAASFADFAPRYIAWLHVRDEAGEQWLKGEEEITVSPAALGGIALHGVIDRIDTLASGALQLIDYKTGSASELKSKVAEPLEDTQLAFYAALMRSTAGVPSGAPLAAAYLALDGKQGIVAIAHDDVETSAAALLDGIAIDLTRLRAGAGLPPLGTGSTCDFCSARGVCRRDDWAEAGA